MPMRIPEPKQLPSGQWYIQLMVDGQRYNKAFDTPEEAAVWAVQVKTRSLEYHKSPRRMTVGEAVSRYIDSKEAVLSPSTVFGYKQILANHMAEISEIQLSDLTQERVQRWVNALSRAGKSPKTISNAHGLLSAALGLYNPDMALRTTFPQKRKQEVQIPSEGDMQAIVAEAKGTQYELPILLAAWLGLRRSEILGLRWQDINGEYLQIRRAVVRGENGPVEKGTKTTSGTRRIHLPPYLAQLIRSRPGIDGPLVPLTGQAIYKGFVRICEKAGVSHYRFHDLRHFNASIMLAEGIPDKYSMQRMGHATNNMLKTTYQHTIKEREAGYDRQIDSHFKSLFNL